MHTFFLEYFLLCFFLGIIFFLLPHISHSVTILQTSKETELRRRNCRCNQAYFLCRHAYVHMYEYMNLNEFYLYLCSSYTHVSSLKPSQRIFVYDSRTATYAASFFLRVFLSGNGFTTFLYHSCLRNLCF